MGKEAPLFFKNNSLPSTDHLPSNIRLMQKNRNGHEGVARCTEVQTYARLSAEGGAQLLPPPASLRARAAIALPASCAAGHDGQT